MFILAASGTAAAAWPPNGVPICANPTCGGSLPVACSDGAGGAFIAWRGVIPGNLDQNIYIHHLLASGELNPLWPTLGVVLCAAPDTQTPMAVMRDGTGGAIVVWDDRRDAALTGTDVYVSRVTAQGAIASNWPVDGAPACTTRRNQTEPFITTDRAGGVIAVWNDGRDGNSDIYAQRITADGTVAPGWPVNGRPIVTLAEMQVVQTAPLTQVDGGAWFVWADARNGPWDIYGLKVLGDGTVSPGWSENGNLLLGGPTVQGTVMSVDDGAGGAYVGWIDSLPEDFESFDLYAIRLLANGAPHPSWPEAGVPVCTAPDLQARLLLDADPSGLQLGWHDYRGINSDIYAQRLTPDGEIAPGWPVDGALVSERFQFEFIEALVADGSGGAYIALEHDETPQKIYVQHMEPSGAPAPGWPPYGIVVADTDHQQDDARLVSDGAGGAIVVWWDQRTGGAGIYAQKFVPDGPVAVVLALASAQAEPDYVRLEWQGVGAGALAAQVERRSETDPWQALGAASPEGLDRLLYEDRAVISGTRYAYRLRYREDDIVRVTAESWVEVPARLVLALEGLRPNPSTGPARIAFTLPDKSPARLELLDIGGRRVLLREVGTLGPGRHVVPLDMPGRLAPGVYLIRLTQGVRTLLARGVVLK